jgi:hypothetical protein
MPGPTSTIIRAVVRDATRHRWATTITGVTFALLGVAGIVVDSTVRVIGVVRGGRRSTDTPVVVARKNTEDKP